MLSAGGCSCNKCAWLHEKFASCFQSLPSSLFIVLDKLALGLDCNESGADVLLCLPSPAVSVPEVMLQARCPCPETLCHGEAGQLHILLHEFRTNFATAISWH